MKTGIKCNDVFIGSMSFPDRKKPCLVIERGYKIQIIGTFNNEECVKAFSDALIQMQGGDV